MKQSQNKPEFSGLFLYFYTKCKCVLIPVFSVFTEVRGKNLTDNVKES